jgi:hypothetical protein
MVDPRVGHAAADVLVPHKIHLLQMADNLHNGKTARPELYWVKAAQSQMLTC